MESLNLLKCKQCGAPLDQSSVVCGSIRCKYCGEVMSIATPIPAASEPRQASSPQIVYQVVQPQEMHYTPAPRYGNKSRGVAILLAAFGGYVGAHQFYLNRIGLGAVSLLFCWTFIPCFIALIDFIRLLCMSDASFNATYNRIL